MVRKITKRQNLSDFSAKIKEMELTEIADAQMKQCYMQVVHGNWEYCILAGS